MTLKPHEQDLLNRVETGIGVGGTWAPSSSGATFAVEDPATGHVIKTIADATVDDAIRAHAQAVHA